jgi:hypothetical protein
LALKQRIPQQSSLFFTNPSFFANSGTPYDSPFKRKEHSRKFCQGHFSLTLEIFKSFADMEILNSLQPQIALEFPQKNDSDFFKGASCNPKAGMLTWDRFFLNS